MSNKFIFLSLLLSTSALIAQNKVSFTIENLEQQPLSGAVLYLDQLSYSANALGQIEVEVKEEKVYQMTVFIEGYETIQQLLTLLDGSTHTIRLTKETTVLDAIQITRTSEEKEVNRGIVRACSCRHQKSSFAPCFLK